MKARNLSLFFIIIFISNSILLDDLSSFFNATYDEDHDGYATLPQMVNYFRFLEHTQDITEADVEHIFHIYDLDDDLKISLFEIVEVAKIQIKSGYEPGHKQIHIGLTGKSDQMQVIWVSNPQAYSTPIVLYGHYPTQLRTSVAASISTYNVGHLGFHGKIYKAVMNGLTPRQKYYYKVGDIQTRTFSQIKEFTAPPQEGAQLPLINIAVFGDMGTFAPFGHSVIHQVAADNFVKPFNFVFLTGDIAYAGMNSQKVGEVQPIWDIFGQLSEKFAAYTPFMPGVGNHESYYNFSSYFHRYYLPRNYPNQTNLWFSFDYGQLHMVHFSSEHPYSIGSEQYQFLQNDLAKARANPNIKWIILGVHRPFYSSSERQAKRTSLANALEDLVYKYEVDIVQTGHQHSYQRSWPLYKDQPIKDGQTQQHFYNPKAPIYVVQGTSGALIRDEWRNPAPEWSVKRLLSYGYGRVQIRGNELKYEYVSVPGGKVIDKWYITK